MSGNQATAIQGMREEFAARYGIATREMVEAGRVRDYLLAMDEPCDIEPGGIVPPLFLLTFGRTRRPQPSRGGAVNAGDEHEFLAAVRIGDTITTSRSLVNIEAKQGSKGCMYFLHSEITYTNQHGVAVGIRRQTTIRWGW
jgi:hypothetical protein